MGYFLLYLGIIWLCVARAQKRGRSAWGWGLFAFFLAPVAVLATWFVGAKRGAATLGVPPGAAGRTSPSRPATAGRRTVTTGGISVSVAAADASVIEVTGPGQVLVRAAASPATAPIAASEASYEPAQLGKLCGEKLGLNRQEISWLNKFYFYGNAFLSIEAGRETTAQLYVAVLKQLERQFKLAGSTLAQEVRALDDQAQQARRQAYAWYSGDSSFSGAGNGAGADIYLALFKLCENAVRELYGHKRKISTQFAPAQLAALEMAFQGRFGQAVGALLPGLLPTLPPPDEAAELALNAHTTTRWKAQLDQLATRLPADAAGFVAGVYRLGQLNAQNPAIEHIFFDASKLVAGHDREEALRLYLHYLHHDLRSATINNKPLTKTIQKSLFAQPEHLTRFTEIARQLTLDNDLAHALAQVPSVYAQQRKKIQLDMRAVQAARQQHSGTVELLNEYLQDEPETLPELPAPPPGETADTVEIELPRPAAAPAAAPATSNFALSLRFTPTQKALLALFAERALTLPQTEVEAFARQHGALRNQLLDGLNEACHELLDDVLIEENGDDYTIYEPYYQQLTTA